MSALICLLFQPSRAQRNTVHVCYHRQHSSSRQAVRCADDFQHSHVQTNATHTAVRSTQRSASPAMHSQPLSPSSCGPSTNISRNSNSSAGQLNEQTKGALATHTRAIPANMLQPSWSSMFLHRPSDGHACMQHNQHISWEPTSLMFSRTRARSSSQLNSMRQPRMLPAPNSKHMRTTPLAVLQMS